jgi:hypothetical protein
MLTYAYIVTFLSMPHCSFCGKSCSTVPGLKNHVDQSSECRKASHEEFGQYANSIWDNIPDNLNPNLGESEPPPPPPSPIQPNFDLPDIQLEEDFQIAEAMLEGEEVGLAAPAQIEPQLLSPHVTVDDATDDDELYVEEFPKENLAGATWGDSKPTFESLYDELKDGRSSHWGPFENEEEWGLAEWLIRNVGQKQTDTFLKLPIVRFINSSD